METRAGTGNEYARVRVQVRKFVPQPNPHPQGEYEGTIGSVALEFETNVSWAHGNRFEIPSSHHHIHVLKPNFPSHCQWQ